MNAALKLVSTSILRHAEQFGVPPSHHRGSRLVCFSPTIREAGAENWGTEGCQTVVLTTVHTKCLCSKISTYSVLAQQAKDPVSG